MTFSEVWLKSLDKIRHRKRNYQLTFDNGHGRAVLRDLAKVCHANETCFNESERVQTLFEGQRLVWLHICKYLNRSSEDILRELNSIPHEQQE